MTTLFPTPWRRTTAQAGLWNLFAWFGRACDQAAGLLLTPIVVAVFSRSLERDLFRISWLVVGFGLGWLFGAALAPYLQQVTVRMMPWIVGGYIVRTAAIVLMTFAVTDSGSSNGQRFQSILICYVAYAIATGIARTAQARHIIRGAPHTLWNPRSAAGTVGTAAVMGVGAVAMWSALSSQDLTWNQSFGRIWILASVALGVATLAAIHEGVDMPEMPASSHRPPQVRDIGSPLRAEISGAWALVITGLAALSFVEVVAFLLIFDEFRRQTLYLRGGLGFLALGWVLGHLLWAPLRRNIGQILFAQAAVGCAAAGTIIALSAPELARTSWFPETVRGHVGLALLIYALGFVFGVGLSIQRLSLAELSSANADLNRWGGLLISALAMLSPLLVGWASSEYEKEWVLVGGIVLAMVVMTSLGVNPGLDAPRLSTRRTSGPVRQALQTRQ